MAEVPPLDTLLVEVADVGAVTPEQLLSRFAQLQRELAATRDRAFGEAIQPGDDLQLDVLGYCDGRLIPFSVRIGQWAPLVPSPELPGFFEALAGAPLGTGLEISLTLPDDYLVDGLRGRPARFLADVRSAREVTLAAEEARAHPGALRAFRHRDRRRARRGPEGSGGLAL